MRRFFWTEVSGEKSCLQCEVLGQPGSILDRGLKLLRGNDASVRFSCKFCGFVSVGIVSVDGSDPHVDQYGVARQASPPKPSRNRPVMPDPLASLADKPYEAPKTDTEALEMAYGEMLPGGELRTIIENGYPADVQAGDWKAERRITPTTIEMGQEKIEEVLIEFIHAGEVVFSRRHSSTEGVPDIESEKKGLKESCLAALRGPSLGMAVARVTTPRGPVAIEPQGYAGIPLVDGNRQVAGDEKIRQRLFNLMRAGG